MDATQEEREKKDQNPEDALLFPNVSAISLIYQAFFPLPKKT